MESDCRSVTQVRLAGLTETRSWKVSSAASVNRRRAGGRRRPAHTFHASVSPGRRRVTAAAHTSGLRVSGSSSHGGPGPQKPAMWAPTVEFTTAGAHIDGLWALAVAMATAGAHGLPACALVVAACGRGRCRLRAWAHSRRRAAREVSAAQDVGSGGRRSCPNARSADLDNRDHRRRDPCLRQRQSVVGRGRRRRDLCLRQRQSVVGRGRRCRDLCLRQRQSVVGRGHWCRGLCLRQRQSADLTRRVAEPVDVGGRRTSRGAGSDEVSARGVRR
jgi:hypothetical protein